MLPGDRLYSTPLVCELCCLVVCAAARSMLVLRCLFFVCPLGEMCGRSSAHQLADQPVEVEDDRGVVALHLGRYRGDVGEM